MSRLDPTPPISAEEAVASSDLKTGRRGKRRRPSGETPPLPHQLMASGRALLGAMFAIVVLLILLMFFRPLGFALEAFDLAILEAFERIRTSALTDVAEALDFLGSDWTIGILRWGTVLALIIFRRFRHLFVLLGAILAVGWVTSMLSLIFVRERPLGIEIIGDWEGGAFPARPVALLAVSLLGIAYTLVLPGRPRTIAKRVSASLIVLLGLAEMYLGTFHPIDIVVGAIIGVAIPVVAFRIFTPNESFPVAYRKGTAAHLDVEGPRGQAIRNALEQQLGLTVTEMKPFGLAGSGGSTPLRLRVEGRDDYLFAKLYAITHLRADRWYKLGRTLLYGRLEDESSFSTVRRLVQYEDYMLRVMSDAGMSTPIPYGFVEITPEREYLLVCEFFDGSHEIVDGEVDDQVIDSALQTVRSLWDNGLAHRDIKPSNLLVKDGQVHLIDVAFGQVRPSPWREAVDLANMMLVLAFKSDPKHVYERATQYFTPEEIAEAFAATRSVTMPSQSRSMLKEARLDLVDQFRKLAPPKRPISIQRWSFRRVMLTIGVLAAASIVAGLTASNLQGAGLLSDPEAARVALPMARPECSRVARSGAIFLLQAQAVPSSSKLMCLSSLPLGWSFRGQDARNGQSRILLDSDRAGVASAIATLTERCDTTGATEVPSDEPGARRFERIDSIGNVFVGQRIYLFQGGCATYDFEFSGEGRTALAEEVTSALSFVDRADADDIYEEQVGKKLELN